MTTARSIWHLDPEGRDRLELVVTVPIKVVSTANLREHHMAKWRRAKAQKQIVGLALGASLSLQGAPGFPCQVTMTRLIGSGGRRLDDDNNVSGFKAIRDAIATLLKVDDGHPWVTWVCDQRKDKPARWGVEIRIVGLRAPLG